MAITAAQVGDPTGLDFLIGMLRVAPDLTVEGVTWREHVLRVIAFRGSDEEIVNWHRANHAKLVFNAVHDCFVVSGQEVPPDLHDAWHKTILQRWEQGEEALGDDALDAAVAAAKIGERSALEYLIEKLKVPVVNIRNTNSVEYFINKRRNAVLRVMAVRGSNKEIIDLYNKHKDKLAFDPVIDKFVLPEAK